MTIWHVYRPYCSHYSNMLLKTQSTSIQNLHQTNLKIVLIHYQTFKQILSSECIVNELIPHRKHISCYYPPAIDHSTYISAVDCQWCNTQQYTQGFKYCIDCYTFPFQSINTRRNYGNKLFHPKKEDRQQE